MSFDFANIKVGKRDHKKIILCYGVPGIGKTTQASKLPAAFFIPVEDGTAELETVAQYVFDDDRVKVENLDEFNGLLDMFLEKDPGTGIENLVIDSISALEPLIYKRICQIGDERGPKENIEDFGFAGGYKRAAKFWIDIFSKLEAIRTKHKVNVWLIGHSQVKTVNDPENEPYDQYTPELYKETLSFFNKNCDAILFAKNKVAIRKVDKGFGQEVSKGFSLGDAILHTKGRPAFIAKNRSQPALPDEMPFDLNLVLSQWGKKS